jgi:phage protein D
MTGTQLFTANTPSVRVDGTEKGELARDLLRLDVCEDTAGLRTMVLRLTAVTPSVDAVGGDPAYLDGGVLDFGSSVTVDFGPPDRARQIFDGVVSAIELCLVDGDLPHVAVYAEDALMGLRMTRRSRTYENVSDADIAAQLASDHGLRADTAADGPTYPVVQQYNQSDLAFLRDRAAQVQAEVWVEDGRLQFATRPHRQAGEVTLVYGNELLSGHLRADLAHQRSSVTVCGFDLDAKDSIEERADDSVIRAEITDGRIGPDVLTDALGEHATVRTREVPTTADQARAWAEAEMRRRGRAFVVADGVTAGTPELTVGTLLRLDRVGTPFSGPGYYTTWVRHSFDPATGSRTRFRAERATVTS